jgi:hypothetical protein
MLCKIPEPERSEADVRREEKQAIRQNDVRLHYADRLMLLSLRENAGFGKDRFERYNAEGYVLGRDYIERYSILDKKAEEYAVDSYWALRRDIRDDCGWDPEVQMWKDSVFETFPADGNTRSIREKHDHRVTYGRGISFYAKQMISMGVGYLRREYGWGMVKLCRVTDPVREGYLAMMRQYLRCSAEGDRIMGDMITDVRKRYNDMQMFSVAYR